MMALVPQLGGERQFDDNSEPPAFNNEDYGKGPQTVFLPLQFVPVAMPVEHHVSEELLMQQHAMQAMQQNAMQAFHQYFQFGFNAGGELALQQWYCDPYWMQSYLQSQQYCYASNEQTVEEYSQNNAKGVRKIQNVYQSSNMDDGKTAEEKDWKNNTKGGKKKKEVDEEAKRRKDEEDAKMKEEAQKTGERVLSMFRNGGKERAAALQDFEHLSFGHDVGIPHDGVAKKKLGEVRSLAAIFVLGNDDVTANERNEFVDHFRRRRGLVSRAVFSKYAHHVIWEIVKESSVAQTRFIIEEVTTEAVEVAKHMFGCRVLCCIVEHFDEKDPNTIILLNKLTERAAELINHEFGHLVMRAVLNQGLPVHKEGILKAVLGNPNIDGQKRLWSLAKDKYGSWIVENVLRHCSGDDWKELIRQLLIEQEQGKKLSELKGLARDQCGHYVAAALLEEAPECLKQKVVDAFRSISQDLRSSRYGKEIWKLFKEEDQQEKLLKEEDQQEPAYQ